IAYVALAWVAQSPRGMALPAPIDHRNRKAAIAQVAHGLEIFLDLLAAPGEDANRALAAGRRRPARKAQLGTIGGANRAGHHIFGNGICGNRDKRHGRGSARCNPSGIKGGNVEKGHDRAHLNAISSVPISLSCRPLPVLREPETSGCTETKARLGWRAGQLQQSLNGGLSMRTYDLTPFYRSTVGFDRLFSLLDQVTSDGSPGYPPYNIERTGENAYRISVAVSGFAQSELSIVAKENTLTIKGENVANENGKEKSEVLYRGIASRAFERVFQLADFVQVKNASLENGLLHVDLVREIPEAKKPRSIPIAGGEKAPQVVDGSANKVAA